MSLLGHPGLVAQAERREYSPAGGWTTVRTYHGPIDAVQGIIPNLVNQGLRFSEFPVQDGIRGVEIRFSDAQDGAAPPTNPDDEQTTTWELVGNDLNKDLFDHPNYTALSEANKKTLKDYRDGAKKIDDADVSALTGNAEKFRDLITKGVEGFTVSQYILRKTGVVALNWSGTFGITNVGDYYATTTDLSDTENVPATLKFSLPTGQWLKRTPTIRQNRDGRWVSSQEWWHADDWSDVLYDEVTP